MRIGILSDTHGRAERAAEGLRLLRDAGAELFVHCGDVGGEEVIDLFVGLPLIFVWGNTDWERDRLTRYAESVGVRCGGLLARLPIDGGATLAVTHGDNPALVREALADPAVRYLCVGHTHVPGERLVGHVRTINPGALHRATQPTVAILDTETDQLQWLHVNV